MAEKSLGCSDSNEKSETNDFEFPSFNAMIGLHETSHEKVREIICTDPAFIQLTEETSISQQGNTEFDQEQFNDAMSQALRNFDIGKMSQRMRNHPLLQNTRPLSISLGSPEATEYFAERMARMRKDPDSKPLLDEIDARCPAAAIKFQDDKDVLKKLAKAATLGASEGLNEDEQISHGKKALDIACGYAQMKYAKILLDAGAFTPGYRRKSSERSAAKHGRKKRGHCKKGDAIALQTIRETPIDEATTSSQCGEAATCCEL